MRRAGDMVEDEISESELEYALEEIDPPPLGYGGTGPGSLGYGAIKCDVLMPPSWRGQITELSDKALQVFWAEAAWFARQEIRRYRRWRGQDEPVLADGFDAEGIAQAAFERMMAREAARMGNAECGLRNVPMRNGDCGLRNEKRGASERGAAERGAAGAWERGEEVVLIFSAEEIRQELRKLIKHRVRWLHERSETRLMVSEWEVLPRRREGELVSIFEYIPGQIPRPDEELMEKEEEQLFGKFKAGFEATLGKRKDLLEVFRRSWEGQERRKIARELGKDVEQVKALRAQVMRRLARFGLKTMDDRPWTNRELGARSGHR